ncbi:MAG: hypothetical protein KJO07_23510 [Deltaproteobacteria bacterium]|nr:hypothetical protein [Deltaproteobacteria bacterium]
MRSPFRNNLLGEGACAVCKVLTGRRQPATGSCQRCNRPLCHEHEHGDHYRCMACEAGYEPPDNLPDAAGSPGFWLVLTTAFAIAAFAMVAMGMDILLLAGASVGVGALGYSTRLLNQRRLRSHRQRFLVADARRKHKALMAGAEILADSGGAIGRM